MTVEQDSGRVGYAETGSQATPEAPAGLRPSGFDPARDVLPTRVLVCGGRQYPNHRFVWRTLDALNANKNLEAVIHGAARGADEWARMWTHSLANMHDGPHPRAVAFPANWKNHGKAAGPIRNQKMLDEGQPDLVVAFPGGAGTNDMVQRALKAGVRVLDLRDRDATLRRREAAEGEASQPGPKASPKFYRTKDHIETD